MLLLLLSLFVALMEWILLHSLLFDALVLAATADNHENAETDEALEIQGNVALLYPHTLVEQVLIEECFGNVDHGLGLRTVSV